MAASYETGTAATPVALLQALETWLTHADQGWTLDSGATDGSGRRAHLHKGAIYANLRAAMNESIWNYNAGAGYGIGLYLGTGYSGASNWRSQAGGPLQTATANTVGAGMHLPSGAITAYHFFHDGADNIHIEIEKSPGLFTHMGWGPSLVKIGYTFDSWYFYGGVDSYSNTSGTGAGITTNSLCPFGATRGSIDSTAFIRVDASVFSGRWVGNGDNTATTGGYTGLRWQSAVDTYSGVDVGSYLGYSLIDARVHQTAFVGALLLPVHAAILQSPQVRFVPVGYPPSVFYCTAVGNGFASGAIYAVGGVNYMVFPSHAVKKLA